MTKNNDPTKRLVNGHRYRQLRAAILAANPICHICGQPGADSIDHEIPRSAGGQNTLGNLRSAHLSCNSAKGDRLPGQPAGGTTGRTTQVAYPTNTRDWWGGPSPR